MPSSSKDNILFQFLNDLNYEKKNLLTEENKKQYPAYIVNRFLSANMDTIYYALEMSQGHFLDVRLQYDFLLRAIPKRKRFCKWLKTEKDEDVELLARYYDCNRTKAREFLKFHTADNLQTIRDYYETGGLKESKRRRTK